MKLYIVTLISPVSTRRLAQKKYRTEPQARRLYDLWVQLYPGCYVSFEERTNA